MTKWAIGIVFSGAALFFAIDSVAETLAQASLGALVANKIGVEEHLLEATLAGYAVGNVQGLATDKVIDWAEAKVVDIKCQDVLQIEWEREEPQRPVPTKLTCNESGVCEVDEKTTRSDCDSQTN